jgi:hypothetical protein
MIAPTSTQIKEIDMRTPAAPHPMIAIGGILQRNPFYAPPPEFLPELRDRRAAHTS